MAILTSKNQTHPKLERYQDGNLQFANPSHPKLERYRDGNLQSANPSKRDASSRIGNPPLSLSLSLSISVRLHTNSAGIVSLCRIHLLWTSTSVRIIISVESARRALSYLGELSSGSDFALITAASRIWSDFRRDFLDFQSNLHSLSVQDSLQQGKSRFP